MNHLERKLFDKVNNACKKMIEDYQNGSFTGEGEQAEFYYRSLCRRETAEFIIDHSSLTSEELLKLFFQNDPALEYDILISPAHKKFDRWIKEQAVLSGWVKDEFIQEKILLYKYIIDKNTRCFHEENEYARTINLEKFRRCLNVFEKLGNELKQRPTNRIKAIIEQYKIQAELLPNRTQKDYLTKGEITLYKKGLLLIRKRFPTIPEIESAISFLEIEGQMSLPALILAKKELDSKKSHI